MLFIKKYYHTKKMKKIGEHLIEQGLLSPTEIEHALKVQQETGSLLGEILQSEGLITAYKFYKEYANFKNLPFVNLEEYKINNSVLVSFDKQEYIEKQYIPFDVKDRVIYIATTDISPELEDFLEEKYKSHKLFITSPYDISWALQRKFAKEYSHESSESLFETMPQHSSKKIFASKSSKLFFIVALILFGFLLSNQQFFIVFLFLLNILYLFSILSKNLFFAAGLVEKFSKKQPPKLDIENYELPVYSILVPLFKEKKNTISSIINALSNMDYPKDKLDIKLICEEVDNETIDIIKAEKPSANFQIIKVPDIYPRTKPKACNYALNFCEGEFVTIYDAEDRPEPSQLKKVLAVFYKSQNDGESDLACVQARLNFYNKNENIITKLFALEYAVLFDYILKGLRRLKVPIPLGGTSNHFRIKVLKTLYAWDPYNVTEDADVGIRLALAGMRTELVDSITMEESPVSLKAWFKQRSRWIKGYFQTFIVHTRQSVKLYKATGFAGYFGFVMFVGTPGIVYVTTPVVLLITVANIAFIDLNLPLFLLNFCFFNLALTIVSNLSIALYIIICKGWFKMLGVALIFPFYWVLHCIASYEAVYQLVKKPHHWNKTEHGVSKFVNDA